MSDDKILRAMASVACHEDVIRKGISQPCDKLAVAVRIDPESGDPYPVCAYHTRGNMMLPVNVLRAATQ